MMDLSLTVRGYKRHLERSHRIDDLTDSEGRPATFSYPTSGDAASSQHLSGFISGVDGLAADLARSVDAFNRDKRRSAEGLRDAIIDKGTEAVQAVQALASALLEALTAGRMAAGMVVESGLMIGATEPLPAGTSRTISAPFLTAIEKHDMWLRQHAADLTDREWASVLRHAGRFVHESGEIVDHVPATFRTRETRRRVFQGSSGGAVRVQRVARFEDAISLTEIVANAGLMTVAETAHLVATKVQTPRA